VSASVRADAATQVEGLKSSLIGLANTKGSSGYLFGGTATGAPPFTQAGAFVGNDDTIGVEVAGGTVATANVSGAKAFTAAGGVDVFQVLDGLSQALGSNSQSGVAATLTGIDQATSQMIAVRGQAGLTSDRLTSASTVSSSLLVSLQSALASDQQADPVQAYSNFAEAQAAYQQNIQVTSQILSLATAAHS
jgi:flagellar hook-associated protein 3 FlgL